MVDSTQLQFTDNDINLTAATVDSVFSLPLPSPNEPKVQSKKKLTSHRILTSEEIIETKRKDVELRKQMEEERVAKQKERELKRKGVKILGKTKMIPLNKVKPCFVCKKKENKLFQNPVWVQCTMCSHWFHTKCMPPFMADYLNAEEVVNFKCHICLA